MEPIRLVLSGAAGVAVGVTWLFGADLWVNVLVTLLGAAFIGTVWAGIGGWCLALCLGEAFAVALGTVNPLLGVLFQPAIAGMVIGVEDRRKLVMGAVIITVSAGAVLLVRHMLLPLLALVVGIAVVALCLMGIEAWVQRQLSGGERV
jgi:hypothetical protein